jgi:hypothetical protein
MKRRLIALEIWVLVLMMSSLVPARASATSQKVGDLLGGVIVFAEGEANAHAGIHGFSLAWA